MQFLVLDIETIVDPSVWTPPAPPPAWELAADPYRACPENVHPGFSIAGTVQPPPVDHFPPPFAWRPICIGAVLLEAVGNAGVMSPRRVGVIEELSSSDPATIELSVLQQFADYVGPQTVVTWNGRRFDLPVLIQRSMRYGIQHPWYFNGRDIRYRYTEEGHCDLADAIADYGSAPSPKLDGMAKLIGLPGKFGDIDGAKVGEAFAAGRIKDIGTYCLSDAVQTAFVWLRWQHLKGKLTTEAYRLSAGALLGVCQHTDRLNAFLPLVDRRLLLLDTEAKAA
jgi:hypothetical protein